MDILHRKVLQKNHTHLVKDLDLGRSHVLDCLREDGLISSNEEELILSERTKRNQNTKLLNYLKKRDPTKQPYDKFKRALMSEYAFIVERLTNSEKELKNLAKESHSKKCTHCVLAKNLIPPDVTHSLYENGVLTDDDLEELNNDNLPRQDRVKQLLELLKNKPDQSDALDHFSRCLESKYKYLVKRDNKDGLEAYIKCSCKEWNGNIDVNANDDKENFSFMTNSTNSNYDECMPIDDYSRISENAVNKHSHPNGVPKCPVFHTLCYGSWSACESSWTGNCRSCEVVGETEGENEDKAICDCTHRQNTIYNYDNDDQPGVIRKNPCTCISNVHEGLDTNDLSKSDNFEDPIHRSQLITQFYNVKCENKFQDNDCNFGEDNTIDTAVTETFRRVYGGRSICEDSWAESADEESDQQRIDAVCSKDDCGCPFICQNNTGLLCETRHLFDQSSELTMAFEIDTLSAGAIFGLTSNIQMIGAQHDHVGLMTMPSDARPPLCRLSSSESFCGVPIVSGQFPIGHCDIKHTPGREKSKRRTKRKRMKSVHETLTQATQMEIAFDDVDGNPDEDHGDKQEDEEDSTDVHIDNKPVNEENNDQPESLAQGACAILKPVFKASPNNKKLMKRCSKLWDQLFFLRETGDWDTFSVVTKKAFGKFENCPDIQVLLYRSEMCVSTFYKNDQAKALEMFEKAIEELPKTEMPNWHLARILPLKVELCTRAKLFEEASNLLEDAKQAMMSLGPCLSTGAVYFFEAIYLGNILQCTRSDTKSAEGITAQVKKCFLTAIEHYQQEETFAIKSFLNQVYLFLALFSLGVDFKRITYIHVRDIKREDISLAEHYLNLFENNCWGHSTNWSRMLFYIGRGEQHKLINNLERSLDYFKQAQLCCMSGKFGEHVTFIENNIGIVSGKLEEKLRLRTLRSEQSADDILKKILESSSSGSGS